MDNLKNVAFRLEKYWFEEASLHLDDNPGEQKVNIDFKPSGVYYKDSGLYKLTFVFTAWEEGKEESDYTVRVKCNGNFRFQKAVGMDEIPGFFFPNSIAILFPYVRAFVSTLTLQANVSPMLLPTINLSPLQDAMRRNTIVKQDMMELYQTVEDRNNPDYLEKNGPIFCDENPWLGPGYYFWDTFYENAEWWGRVHYAGNYMICSESSSKENEMLDLVGNTSHLIAMQEAANKFRKRFPNKKLRVARVLAFIKGEVKSFPYKAVRANPVNSKHYSEDMEEQIVYFAGHSYLELFPPIQVCVYDKCFLSGNFQVIYPPEYKQGFTIQLTTKQIAYSGGGYFRLLPYWLVDKTMKRRDYNICYFHLNDLIKQKIAFRSKAEYEEYFKEPGTLRNRILRYAKSNVGTGDAFAKFQRLLSEHLFVSMQEADKMIEWGNVKTIVL